MGKIKEYVSQQAPSAPISTAKEAGEAASAPYMGIASGLHTVSDAIKRYNDTQESSKLAANAATAHAQLTTDWEDLKQKDDVSDPEVVAKFMEHVQKTVDDFGSDIGSQAVRGRYEEVSASMIGNFAVKTAADRATAAGEAAVANAKKVMNNLSLSVAKDPHSLAEVLDLDAFMLGGLGLSKKALADLHQAHGTEYAQAAVLGLIENGNTDKAREILNSGKLDSYIDQSQKFTLNNHINAEERAKSSEVRAAAVEQRRQQTADAQTVARAISASIVIDPASGRVVLPPGYFQAVVKYSMMPHAEDGTVRALQSAGEQALKTPMLASDQATKTNFLNRIWLSPDDPQRLSLADIDSAYGQQLLTGEDHTMLRQSLMDADKDPNKVQNMRSLKQAEESFKAFISKSTLMTADGDGDQRYGMFIEDKDRQFQQGLKDGLKPQDMLDPRSSKYIFKDVGRYPPPQDASRLQNQFQGNGAPIAPPALVPWAQAPAASGGAPGKGMRKPGESAADFLKRAQ